VLIPASTTHSRTPPAESGTAAASGIGPCDAVFLRRRQYSQSGAVPQQKSDRNSRPAEPDSAMRHHREGRRHSERSAIRQFQIISTTNFGARFLRQRQRKLPAIVVTPTPLWRHKNQCLPCSFPSYGGARRPRERFGHRFRSSGSIRYSRAPAAWTAHIRLVPVDAAIRSSTCRGAQILNRTQRLLGLHPDHHGTRQLCAISDRSPATAMSRTPGDSKLRPASASASRRRRLHPARSGGGERSRLANSGVSGMRTGKSLV